MTRSMRTLPLLYKIVALFTVLMVLVCLAMGVFTYENALKRQQEEITLQSLLMLKGMATAAENRMAQTEILLKELATDAKIIPMITAPTLEKTIITLCYEVMPRIQSAEVYLMQNEAEIRILTDAENLPLCQDYIRDFSALSGVAFFSDFLKSGQNIGWNFEEKLLTELERKKLEEEEKENLSCAACYYRVYSKGTGLDVFLRLEMPAYAFFKEAIQWENTGWDGNGRLYLHDGSRTVFSVGNETALPEAESYPERVSWKEKDVLYVSADISNLNLNLVQAFPLDWIRAQALEETLFSSCMIAAVGLILLLGICLLLNRMLYRLNNLTRAVKQMTLKGDHLRLPEKGEDEIGRLARAFEQMVCQIDADYEAILQKEKAKRKADTLALQYQMNPHFLFNALYTLQFKMEECGIGEELSTALSRLGQTLRYNLNGSPFALMADEETQMQAYIEFLSIIKNTPIVLQMDVPAEARKFQILRFSLQPILENSVQHGCVMGVPLHIGVRAVIEREKNRFVLSVENDGKEIPPEKLEGLRERIAQARESLPEIRDRGVGMVNLMRRLELNYGKDADMSLTSAEGRTCFELVLPLNQCEREEGTDEFSGGGR